MDKCSGPKGVHNRRLLLYDFLGELCRVNLLCLNLAVVLIRLEVGVSLMFTASSTLCVSASLYNPVTGPRPLEQPRGSKGFFRLMTYCSATGFGYILAFVFVFVHRRNKGAYYSLVVL